MRVRTYGLLLLGVAGIVPLAIYGTLVVQQSQNAAREQACSSSERLTEIIVDRVQAYAQVEQDMLENVGIGTLQAQRPASTLQAFTLGRRSKQFEAPVVYRSEGDKLEVIAGTPLPGKESEYLALAMDARHGQPRHSALETAQLPEKGEANVITIAMPIRIAGKITGAIAATYDTMGMWRPVNEERIGQTGYAAIVTPEGRLLAHGNIDKRRFVFPANPSRDNVRSRAAADSSLSSDYARLVRLAGTQSSKTCRVLGGNVVSIAKGYFFGPGPKARAAASRPGGSGVEWYVVIEQSGAETFTEARTLKQTLLMVGAIVLVLVLVTSVLGGRHLVRALEDLREHTKKLGHDLSEQTRPKSRLLEVRSLAHALNEMAANLIKERDAARSRERLATFARVGAGLAHDLRLPIEAVRGACERVNSRPDDEAARQLLKKVTERELPRLKRYVDDLGRLAHEGHIELEFQSTQIDALLDDICNELAITPKWRGVQFKRTGSTATVAVDRNLIHRAVMNLAGNAADACLEKSLVAEAPLRAARDNRVTIDLADSTNPELFEIRVIDTGIGISAERLEILKEGDFQSTKRSTGVGLGLGVAKQIAAAHGGELSMSSHAGSGSTFILRLPRTSSPSQRA